MGWQWRSNGKSYNSLSGISTIFKPFLSANFSKKWEWEDSREISDFSYFAQF